MKLMKIRSASPDDAAALLEIYRPYVEETAVTFDYEAPSPEEFRARIAGLLEKYPYLVAEEDGVPVAYAYAGPLSRRAAYQWSAETSIYVRHDFRRKGPETEGLVFGKAFGYSIEEITVASNANIGGPTTAAAFAIAKGWHTLIFPAILVGTLGYVIGNYYGIFLFTSLK